MIADISDADHVARYCSPHKPEEDRTPAPGAFRPRDRDDCCLSVNWLECFEGQNVDVNIQHVRKKLRKHYKTKRSGKLAALNMGVAKRATRQPITPTPVLGEPLRTVTDPMHWRIFNKQ